MSGSHRLMHEEHLDAGASSFEIQGKILLYVTGGSERSRHLPGPRFSRAVFQLGGAKHYNYQEGLDFWVKMGNCKTKMVELVDDTSWTAAAFKSRADQG